MTLTLSDHQDEINRLKWHIWNAKRWLENIEIIEKLLFENYWTKIRKILVQKWLIPDEPILRPRLKEKPIEKSKADKWELQWLYRQLAMKHHPDRNPWDDWSSEALFKEATAAYKNEDMDKLTDMLSDLWNLTPENVSESLDSIRSQFMDIAPKLFSISFFWIEELNYIKYSSNYHLDIIKVDLKEEEYKDETLQLVEIIWEKAILILENYKQ